MKIQCSHEEPLCPPIPDFLLVENRKAPDPEKLAALRAAWAGSRQVDPHAGRRDYRKPPSLTWEAWDTFQAREETEKKAATHVRIARMLEKKGLPAPQSKTKKGRVPRTHPRGTP